jgi:drug/metabolite transporter (DMT)-like permease
LNTRSTKFAAVMLAGLSLVWGYSWITNKIGILHSSPFDFAAMRVVVGAIGMFMLMLIQGRSLRFQHGKFNALIGLLQTSAFFLLTSWAVLHAGAGKTSVLVFIMPFWTLLLARIFLGERIQGLQWIAVMLAFAGLVLILAPWQFQGSWLSSMPGVIAGFIWAVTSILIKRYSKNHALDVFSMTAWQLVIGAVPLIAVAWAVPSPPIQWTWQFFACLFFSGFVATALGWVIWMYVLDVLPAGTASLSTLAIPVITVVGAALQLGEVPAPHEIQGMLLVAVALALLSYLGVRQHRRDDPVLGQE